MCLVSLCLLVLLLYTNAQLLSRLSTDRWLDNLHRVVQWAVVTDIRHHRHYHDDV